MPLAVLRMEDFFFFFSLEIVTDDSAGSEPSRSLAPNVDDVFYLRLLWQG